MAHVKAEIIETARLVLEPLRIEHAEPMAIVLADPQLHAFIGGAPATDGLHAEIAWVIGTAWQRRSIATEATRALVEWLTRQPIHAVIAHIHPDHHASAAVATAAGLTPTAELHDGEIRWHKNIDR
jgi:RimJ/RimL family protein N-acetyltransferase